MQCLLAVEQWHFLNPGKTIFSTGFTLWILERGRFSVEVHSHSTVLEMKDETG
jgi:hypothetical protein